MKFAAAWKALVPRNERRSIMKGKHLSLGYRSDIEVAMLPGIITSSTFQQAPSKNRKHGQVGG